ncbi:MAG: hypothetical protein ABSG28_07345 [Methanoregula sp.]|uniref:hypothetical protein n=1 Tax=Methanoregula sp. TaxID=2052170 RepID=UPI003C134645
MRCIFGSIAFLMLLLIVAGCTQPTAPQATPVPTTAPTMAVPVTTTMVVPTTFVPATPGPTQTLQANWAVAVQVQSNGQAINPQVIYTFNGGMGMNLIPEIDVMLTRSDGTVEVGNFTQPMSIGQTVSLPGSTGNNDRAEVWVITPQGDRVKIVDTYVPFRSYH